MKRTFFIITMALSALFIFEACQQDVDEFIPNPTEEPDLPIGDINNFFQALQGDFDSSYDLPCQTFSELVILPSGTIIEVRADQFALPADIDCDANNGRPLKMTVTEIDSKGEIIMGGKQTVSDGRLLESRAEYLIEVTYDGEPVKLREGKQLRILVEDDSPVQQMELFYGGSDANGFNWEQADGDDNTWGGANPQEWAFQDSSNTLFGFGYECFSDSLNWINVDIFKDVPDDQKTTACNELSRSSPTPTRPLSLSLMTSTGWSA